MFTGIITSMGEITATERRGDDLRLTVACDYRPETIAIGASIACSGVCLTATARGPHARGGWFTADVSAETLSKTTLGAWNRRPSQP